MSGWLIPVIQGASTLGTGYFGYKGQKESNRMQRQIAREAQAFDLKMWNLQNQYNDPSNQMSRLKNAGLNPNLVYGSGNVSGLMASAPPRGREYEYKSPLPQLGNVVFGSAQSVLSAYQDYKLKEAQIDNTEAVANLNWQKRATEFENSIIKGFESAMKGLDSGKQQILAQSQVDYQMAKWKQEIKKLELENEDKSFKVNKFNEETLRKVKADIKFKNTMSALKGLEVDVNTPLAGSSMTSKDWYVWRLLLNSYSGLEDVFENRNTKNFRGKNMYGSGSSW